jgi:acylphosphatase
MKKRVVAFYSGRVQGVGFRYTAKALARRFPVLGSVRNLRDGRVELVSEGEQADLEAYLKAIRSSGLGAYIHDVDLKWGEPEGGFETFEITF